MARLVGNMVNKAARLHDDEDDDAAEPLLRHALELSRETLGDLHRQTASALASLGSVLVSKGAHEEAESVLRECLSIRQEILAEDSWLLYHVMSLLGTSVGGQGKYAEAEPLLLRGYELMNPPESRSSRKRQALEHLVELYEDWDKPDEAARWRKLLDS